MGRVLIRGLEVRGILGAYTAERNVERPILIDLDLETDTERAGASDDLADCVDYHRLCDQIAAHAKEAARFTVEALAADVVRLALADPRVSWARVTVEKPGAVPGCRSVGVRLEKSRE